MKEIPILIVGGGTAGTMLTLELARRGVKHLTVDRLAKPSETSRAITMHARTCEIMERLDKRLIDRYLERGIHNLGYVLHFVDANGKRSEVRPGIDFTKLDSRYPYILVHRQSETEQYLREYTSAHYGVGVEWGTQCLDVKQDADGVTATLESDGKTREIRCRYLVACDGINSRVRRSLGLEQQESDYKGTVLQNMDAFLNDFPDVDDYVHYCAGTDHFIMIVKLPGGFYRMLLSDRGEAAGPNVTPEQGFMRLVNKHFDGVTLGNVVWHSKWSSYIRLAHAYRYGNVFLAGDSAHVHSTTGGQGMNCCLQDSYNLGWKLALVTQGLAPPALLDTYETERKPIAEQVIWAASSLHEIFMGHGKDIAERAQKIKDPEFLDAVIGRCSGLSYTYRDHVETTEGLEPIAGPQNGDRAPDADLGGGKALYDFTRHPKFTLLLLAAHDDHSSARASLLRHLSQRFHAVLEAHVVAPSPDVTRHYGESTHDRFFLLRPDGYVGFRCLVTEADKLEAYLAHTFTH